MNHNDESMTGIDSGFTEAVKRKQLDDRLAEAQREIENKQHDPIMKRDNWKDGKR